MERSGFVVQSYLADKQDAGHMSQRHEDKTMALRAAEMRTRSMVDRRNFGRRGSFVSVWDLGGQGSRTQTTTRNAFALSNKNSECEYVV